FKKYKKSSKFFFTILYNHEPIGIVGLSAVSVEKKNAEVFILIGEKKFRGRGFGKEAINFIVNYAKEELLLDSLYLTLKKENVIALSLYLASGFQIIREDKDEFEMVLKIK
ncbi:MAG: hypothetical protein C0412_21675, partial [Flavobacterium sp.]|nr:hypothetical protein [Flavobacterium sp.]